MVWAKEVSSQTGIRKYDFQKFAMTSSNIRHYVFKVVRVTYAMICYKLTKYQVKAVSGDTIVIRHDVTMTSLYSSYYVSKFFKMSHYVVIVYPPVFKTLCACYVLWTDQVSSISSIRKYDFRKFAMMLLWRHYIVAIMFPNLPGCHMLCWPGIKLKFSEIRYDVTMTFQNF